MVLGRVSLLFGAMGSLFGNHDGFEPNTPSLETEMSFETDEMTPVSMRGCFLEDLETMLMRCLEASGYKATPNRAFGTTSDHCISPGPQGTADAVSENAPEMLVCKEVRACLSWVAFRKVGRFPTVLGQASLSCSS
jgi:hypothetical protein